MELLWFCFLAALLSGYVLLDGYDLGTGVLHLFVARTDDEIVGLDRRVRHAWSPTPTRPATFLCANTVYPITSSIPGMNQKSATVSARGDDAVL